MTTQRPRWYPNARLDDEATLDGKTYRVTKVDPDGCVWWGTGGRQEICCSPQRTPKTPVGLTAPDLIPVWRIPMAQHEKILWWRTVGNAFGLNYNLQSQSAAVHQDVLDKAVMRVLRARAEAQGKVAKFSTRIHDDISVEFVDKEEATDGS